MTIVENLNMAWMDWLSGKCAMCKKKFPKPMTGGDWGYSYKGRECCSYHCMRALERKDKNSWLHIKEAEEQAERERTQVPEYIKTGSRKDNWTRITEEEKQLILKLWIGGKTMKEIGELIERSPQAISRTLEELNARIQEKRRKWITEEQSRIMQEWRDQGRTVAWIAKRLGLNEKTVRAHTKATRAGSRVQGTG